ncbi:hypothetical protein ACFOSC_11320 [Streptantibioticus rubrisoli]|uniref:Uncharacterized protein n=1 Tax=Streptantibioticus rubrisoli TaxID=1387313 RepID=A0ABT1PEA2_9ACTN|nr:hypothetical protein [Streptantibioticus rubrisoli]MCQ4043705.1 hypothetical protein [Streptantibioticus rubrisoli]
MRDGRWPLWHYVERKMSERELDAHDVLRSLPRVPAGSSQSYGFTISAQPAMYEQAPARLTIAACLVLPDFNLVVGAPFLRVLHHAIKVYTDTPVSPHEITRPTVTSA